VIARALDSDPRQRFPGCEELLDALAAAARPAMLVAPPPTPKPELPAFMPVANLCGGAESLAEAPSIRHLVTQIVLAETSALGLRAADRLSYLCCKDRGLEAKFAVSVAPSMIQLKLAFFCEQWCAKIVSQNDRQFVLRMRGTESMLQRWLGRDVGVEVRLNLQPLPGTRGFSSEAAVTVQPYGGAKHPSARQLDEVGPLLLLSLRDSLQTTTDQRGEIRWPCSKALDVYPVIDDGTGAVGDPLEAKGVDVSFTGVAFWAPQRPTAQLAYVVFKTFPELASLAVLVRSVHVESVEEGGFKVGAAFGMPPAQLPSAAAGRTTAAKDAVSPPQLMDSFLSH
jgi:hypothetical protein